MSFFVFVTDGTPTNQSVVKDYFPSLNITPLNRRLFPNIEFSDILESPTVRLLLLVRIVYIQYSY